ncbi:MAG: MG2 domain-containing protein, partial [Paracoccaceae bacterium]
MAAAADSPIPERRVVVTQDVDFYGSDLQALFDTTREACQRSCLANPECQAFTFNTRSNACFPKGAISERVAYEGAVSGEVIDTPDALRVAAEARVAEIEFLRPEDLSAARRQAQELGMRHPGGNWAPQVLLETASAREAEGKISEARHWIGAALSQTDAADLWLDYARLSRRVAEEDRAAARENPERALSAALNGYLRAGNTPQQVSALVSLARSLEAAGRGRQMIPALRLARGLQPREDVVSLLDRAVAQYGFRVADHRVESDQASPRLCAEFTEPLAEGVDYTPYLRLPVSGLAVSAEDRLICVEGVEHGSRYTVVFREGLPAASGETLTRNVELRLYVRDRQPSVRFPGRSYVLPRTEEAGVPIETVNLDTVDLLLRRVSDRNLLRAVQEDFFGRPLSYYQQQRFGEEIAEEVWRGTGEVRNDLNRDMTTRLPMAEVVAELPPGIYALTASVPGVESYDDPGATQWFVLSDLGLTAMQGNDGLHVVARGLSDAEAREGVSVQLLSRANAVLGEAVTDAEGQARFSAGLTRGEGGAAPAMVVAQAGEEDLAFLSLTEPAFDLSDRGVEGREPAPPIDVFLATDRGAYRPGEAIHVTALARDAQAEAIPGLPLTAILIRPDGVEYSRRTSPRDVAGGHVFRLPLGPGVPRGAWRLEVRADPDAAALASLSLLVEDFLPERIDVSLSLPETPLRPGENAQLDVEARHLFGAPAGGLPVEGQVRVVPRDRIESFPGYVFGRHDDRPQPRTAWLPEGTHTDATGRAAISVDLPALEGAGLPAEAIFAVAVSEGSGRPIERDLTRALAPSGPMIGIRPEFEGVVPEGSEAGFRLLALGPDLQPQPMRLRWTLNRVETRYQWYQLHGNWNWEPTTTRTRVATAEVSLGDEPARVAAPVDWGRYELVVERMDGDHVASSTEFHAGWFAPADASQTPDTLDLSLDAESYAVGETATLRIVPRYAGTAMVAVMSDRLISMQAIEVPEGESAIPLEVTEDWGTGAYVTAQVIRPMESEAGRNPARALGLAHAAVEPGAKQLQVSLDTAAQSDPRGPLRAAVQVEGLAGDEQTHVTVAAVDVGILNLTGFEAP